MIIQLKGKVSFPITLDPSVWIFDDRKIMLEEAFEKREEKVEEDPVKKADELFNQEIYFQKHIKPPVNKSLNSEERKKALIHSFVMPINDFIKIAEPNKDAKNARLILHQSDEQIIISLEQLMDALMLFAIDGKQIKEQGPAHLYFGDGSNKDEPIKGIKEIIIE